MNLQRAANSLVAFGGALERVPELHGLCANPLFVAGLDHLIAASAKSLSPA
jgi:hypothetical protein